MLAIPLVSNSTTLLACVPVSKTKSLVYRLFATPNQRLFDITSSNTSQLVGEFPHVIQGTAESTMFCFYLPTLSCKSFYLTRDEFERLKDANRFFVTDQEIRSVCR